MTSADFLQFVVTMLCFEYVYFITPARPPWVSVITFTSYICCIYTLKFGQYRTSFCLGNSSVSKCLICSFCPSDRGFASDFFRTLLHSGRPCLQLTVPTAKPVADFHRQVVTHAEHTSKAATLEINLRWRLSVSYQHITLTANTTPKKLVFVQHLFDWKNKLDLRYKRATERCQSNGLGAKN